MDKNNEINRKELIRRVVRSVGCSKKIATTFIDGIFDTIKNAIINGETVNVVGFGKFEVSEVGERVRRNPKSGESVIVTPSKKVKFKLSTNIKKQLKGE